MIKAGIHLHQSKFLWSANKLQIKTGSIFINAVFEAGAWNYKVIFQYAAYNYMMARTYLAPFYRSFRLCLFLLRRHPVSSLLGERLVQTMVLQTRLARELGHVP